MSIFWNGHYHADAAPDDFPWRLLLASWEDTYRAYRIAVQCAAQFRHNNRRMAAIYLQRARDIRRSQWRWNTLRAAVKRLRPMPEVGCSYGT